MTDDNNKKEDNNDHDHSWRYFELHAGQRISLIRYYVIILSLYVTGAGYLVAKLEDVSCIQEKGIIFLSLFFIFITLIFWFLDNRNRNLIHMAEDSLRNIEEGNNSPPIQKIFTREKESSGCSIRHTHCFWTLFGGSIAAAILITFYSWHHMYLPDDNLSNTSIACECIKNAVSHPSTVKK